MNAMNGPANTAEIGGEILRLTRGIQPARGRNVDGLTEAYFSGLKGFPIEAIRDAIDGFFSGRFGEKRWLPEAPELAFMVRSCLERGGSKTDGRAMGWTKPNSRLRKAGCTSEWAREQVHRGFAPRGSIWTPGSYGENAAFGDFWDPDPRWAGPKRIRTAAEMQADDEWENRNQPSEAEMEITRQKVERLTKKRASRLRPPGPGVPFALTDGERNAMVEQMERWQAEARERQAVATDPDQFKKLKP